MQIFTDNQITQPSLCGDVRSWYSEAHFILERTRRTRESCGLGNSALASARSIGTGCLSVRWVEPIEIIIPSATAKTVRTTNFKVIAFWVIADTRFDLPHAINATFY
jgi:hypothetical protein